MPEDLKGRDKRMCLRKFKAELAYTKGGQRGNKTRHTYETFPSKAEEAQNLEL